MNVIQGQPSGIFPEKKKKKQDIDYTAIPGIFDFILIWCSLELNKLEATLHMSAAMLNFDASRLNKYMSNK